MMWYKSTKWCRFFLISILNGKLGFYPSEYDRSETAEELNFRINKYYAKKMVQANNK